jgi:hypothetical protein
MTDQSSTPQSIPKTVSAYQRVSDVDVLMTIVHPPRIVGLGNVLILNPNVEQIQNPDTSSERDKLGLTENDRENGVYMRKTDTKSGATYVEYSDVDAVGYDYGEEAGIYKKASAYFAQANPSDRIAVLTYDPTQLHDSLEAFWYFDWTFAIQAESNVGDETLSLSNVFEANKDHFLVLQSADPSVYASYKGQNYTIGLVHDLDEPMDAALLGSTALLTVGSTTWKFRNLVGITPDLLTANELNGIAASYAIAYVEVAGQGETSEGTSLSGEYIDTLHGALWVKTEMQNRLERLLQSNNKIPYEQSGINMIQGVATTVLEQAWEQGIVLTNESNGKGDYNVTATPRSAQSTDDLSKRHYGGLSFTYHASGAIHTITVHGTLNSDTILN